MADWVAAPGGLSTNAGTLASPWDIPSALNAASHPGSVQAGDTIWIRGGNLGLTDTGLTWSVAGAVGTGVDNIDSKVVVRAYNPTVYGSARSAWLSGGLGTATGTGDLSQQERVTITETNTSAAPTSGATTVNGVNASGSLTVSIAKAAGVNQAIAVGQGLTIATGPAAGWYMINAAGTITQGANTTVTITPGLRGSTAGGEVVTLTLNPSGVDATAISGSYMWVWGIELAASLSLRSAPVYAGAGFSNFGQTSVGLKFIYCQAHDFGGTPFFMERTSGRTELYGCLTYNTGGTGTGDGGGHDYYIHHNDTTNRLRIEAAVMANGFTQHLQLYDASGNPLNTIDLVNCISLNAGANSSDANLGGPNAGSYILGGSTAGVFSGVSMTGCYALQVDGNGDFAWWLGSGGGLGSGITITGNYARVSGTGYGAYRQSASVYTGGSLTHQNNTYRVYRSDATHNGYVYRVPNNAPVNTTWGGDTIYRSYGAGGNACGSELPSGPAFIGVDGTGGCRTLTQFASDTGLTGDTIQQDPSGVNVFVIRCDKYEAGRAWVVYDNYAGATSISVNLSSILATGDTFVVHDWRNTWAGISGQAGAPVIRPVQYQGGTVSFPTTQLADPAVSGGHAGVSLEVTPPATAPKFNVFLVRRTAVAQNNPPPPPPPPPNSLTGAQLQAEIYGVRVPSYPYHDRISGVTGTALTLSFAPLLNPNAPVPAPLVLTKNGTLLDPGGASPAYTLSGSTVTLAVAAISTDVFVAYYWYQSAGVLV